MAIHHQTTQLRNLPLEAANMPVFGTQKAVRSFSMPRNSNQFPSLGPALSSHSGARPSLMHCSFARAGGIATLLPRRRSDKVVLLVLPGLVVIRRIASVAICAGIWRARIEASSPVLGASTRTISRAVVVGRSVRIVTGPRWTIARWYGAAVHDLIVIHVIHIPVRWSPGLIVSHTVLICIA